MGTVTLVNAATKEVTVKTQGADAKEIVVEPADKLRVRKYAPNSVKFSDAVPSTVAEIKSGDTIRVLGTKNDDGTRVKPEQIVFGTIIRQAGTILAIDTVAGTVKMTDLASKKPLTVKVNASTTIKRLPPMMATMMANAQNGGRGGMAGAGAAGTPAGGMRTGQAGADTRVGQTGAGMRAGQERPAGAAAASGGPGAGGPGGSSSGPGGNSGPGSFGGQSGPGGPGGMGGFGGGMGGRRPDPSKMLERIPSITLADLKAGDAIIISSSGGSEPTAISLVAGVEALLTAPTRPGQAAGPNTSWNFEMSIPQ